MNARRKKTINGILIEEFYWHSEYPVYVDNLLVKMTFEKACQKIKEATKNNSRAGN